MVDEKVGSFEADKGGRASPGSKGTRVPGSGGCLSSQRRRVEVSGATALSP